MGLQFLFMDDNAPCHRTVAAEQLLESRRLAARTLPPVTIRELRLALQDEWAAMPQQLIDTLILSMGRSCETCLAVREIISPTKDQMFLAGHPSQECFGLQSHCAPCYFSVKLLFIPLISLFSKCCLHITHVLTYWDLTGLKNWGSRFKLICSPHQPIVIWTSAHVAPLTSSTNSHDRRKAANDWDGHSRLKEVLRVQFRKGCWGLNH
ncbi:transposable element Tcb2 transposase [Trichonephila clavipes]|uniref:Transposable element Tcb2 transposase n=1 Tax=Trichonephila clavipes TaxID=2585209 RepID=A0A8X6SSX9_TRICX|nr:transposable element Tcb2 transposase [Trichonephila clavipes]